MKQVHAEPKGLVASGRGFGDREASETSKRVYEIDSETHQLRTALNDLRELVNDLAERLTPVLSEAEDKGEGKCESKVTSPLAIEIQGSRHQVEAFAGTLRDILRRLELDYDGTQKTKAMDR